MHFRQLLALIIASILQIGCGSTPGWTSPSRSGLELDAHFTRLDHSLVIEYEVSNHSGEDLWVAIAPTATHASGKLFVDSATSGSTAFYACLAPRPADYEELMPSSGAFVVPLKKGQKKRFTSTHELPLMQNVAFPTEERLTLESARFFVVLGYWRATDVSPKPMEPEQRRRLATKGDVGECAVLLEGPAFLSEEAARSLWLRGLLVGDDHSIGVRQFQRAVCSP